MDRFWVGIGLLVLCFAVGLWSGIAMDARHQAISDTLDQASQQALAGDLEAATRSLKDAQTRWQKSRSATAAMADHAPMEEIDSLFAQVQSYANADDLTDFASYCARLSKLVAAVGEAHALSFENLL